ncbi:MAG TPA: DinB family protein [Vicinamibacterales bacterium]|nr:DinB family protein [Vicinamibacterales bacterium]
MPLIDGLLQEMEQEAVATRRLLERVPNAKLTWKPHPKSRTLGELALHVAMTPGAVAEFVKNSPVQAPDFADPSPGSASELVPAMDESIATARRVLEKMDDATLHETWRMMRGDKEVLALPRIAMLRSIMLNHWYHHRGQLSVYLRELDVPIPSIYGPTADENPLS